MHGKRHELKEVDCKIYDKWIMLNGIFTNHYTLYAAERTGQMDPLVVSALIGGGAGLVTGAIASLIAPWVHWGIEKRRTRRESRRALIADARGYVASHLFGGTTFSAKPIYSQLKPHLRHELIEMIENYERVLDQQDDPGKFPKLFREEVLNEISRVERKWKLI